MSLIMPHKYEWNFIINESYSKDPPPDSEKMISNFV